MKMKDFNSIKRKDIIKQKKIFNIYSTYCSDMMKHYIKLLQEENIYVSLVFNLYDSYYNTKENISGYNILSLIGDLERIRKNIGEFREEEKKIISEYTDYFYNLLNKLKKYNGTDIIIFKLKDKKYSKKLKEIIDDEDRNEYYLKIDFYSDKIMLPISKIKILKIMENNFTNCFDIKKFYERKFK